MEPPTLYAPKPTSAPSDLQNALLAWNQHRASEPHMTRQTHSAAAPYAVESQFQDASPPEASSRLEEYTRYKLMNQMQVLQPKLAYFRMLLACATLTAEQRGALQQFAADLRTTMDLVLAKDEADGAPQGQATSPRSLSEDDITNMSVASFASPASASSWEGSFSVVSKYSVDPALFAGTAAQLDGGHSSSSFASPASMTSQEALQGSIDMSAFDLEAIYSANELSMPQEGLSYTYGLPQPQGSSSMSGINGSDPSPFPPQDPALWYSSHEQWTDVPQGSASAECGTTTTTQPAPQPSPWDSDLHIPGSFDGYGCGGTVLLPVCEDHESGAATHFVPVSLREWCAMQAQSVGEDARLQAARMEARGPSSPQLSSWSSSMSECSVAV